MIHVVNREVSKCDKKLIKKTLFETSRCLVIGKDLKVFSNGRGPLIMKVSTELTVEFFKKYIISAKYHTNRILSLCSSCMYTYGACTKCVSKKT